MVFRVPHLNPQGGKLQGNPSPGAESVRRGQSEASMFLILKEFQIPHYGALGDEEQGFPQPPRGISDKAGA